MTIERNKELLDEVADYYSEKLNAHGQTPRGVDWNGEESQLRRFAELCKIINVPGNFSLNDLGCGYGALYDYLTVHFLSFSYCGLDVSQEMVDAAIARYKGNPRTQFILASKPKEIADFSVASGIFNVRQTRSDEEWQSYIEQTLDILDNSSRLGFSFNCLTSYSDADKTQKHLHYANPCALFDLCKKRYSRNVALLHDYQLYEFTILVRK